MQTMYVLNKPQVFTHSVHITIGFGGGHLHHQKIHYVSYITALKSARNSPSQIKSPLLKTQGIHQVI